MVDRWRWRTTTLLFSNFPFFFLCVCALLSPRFCGIPFGLSTPPPHTHFLNNVCSHHVHHRYWGRHRHEQPGIDPTGAVHAQSEPIGRLLGRCWPDRARRRDRYRFIGAKGGGGACDWICSFDRRKEVDFFWGGGGETSEANPKQSIDTWRGSVNVFPSICLPTG